MSKYVCSVCGYVYDEENEKIKFDELSSDWTCPLCGASKQNFIKQALKAEALKEAVKTKSKEAKAEALKEAVNTKSKEASEIQLSNAEMNVLCTNLAKGCEKQYKGEEALLFGEIAEFYKKNSEKAIENSFDGIITRLNSDLTENFSQCFSLARADFDRGALRVLTWSEKVSKIASSLIARYKSEGVKFLENNKIFVCEICGFIYIGNEAPEICPICKVPKFKIHEVGRV